MSKTETTVNKPDETLKSSDNLQPKPSEPATEKKQPTSFGDTELNKGLEAQAKDEETAP